MATPILPNRTLLRELRLTPKELLRDQEIETILRDHYALLTGLLTAWRSGLETYAYTAANASTAASLRIILAEYGYWVQSAPLPGSATVNFSWAASSPYL
jgi:hypothetical protein